MQVIPSSYDAMIITANINGVPSIGFYNQDTNKLEVISVVHFELLLASYMKNYVNPVRKN